MSPQFILEKAMQKISDASAKSNLAEISRITKIATRVQEIQVTVASLENELLALDSAITRATTSIPSTITNESPQKTTLAGDLLIEINFPQMGYPAPKQSLCMRTGSATLISCIENLVKSLGPEILPKLGKIQISRAPLLSQSPDKDFLNRKKKTTYSHHPVSDSGWFVFTNNSTKEKIDAIKEIGRALNLSPGSISARLVSKEEQNGIFDLS